MDELYALISKSLDELGVRRTERVLVAVSGGADSVALLRLLTGLDQRVAVGHVHHGLRACAGHDAHFVAALARALGLPHAERRVDASVRDGQSPEARARSLRYDALEELRGELDCRWIATGHTLDDQAETVLLRAVRGTGLDGLAAIAPRRGVLVRPMLRARRHSLRSLLGELGQSWCEDASNLELSVPRNRLRHSVLPELEKLHSGAARKLAELAELAREARDEQGASVETALARASAADAADWLDPEPLEQLDPPGRTRALRTWLVRAGFAASITRRHVERVARFLANAPRGASLSLPEQRALVRRGDRFWLAPPKPVGKGKGRAPGPAASSL